MDGRRSRPDPDDEEYRRRELLEHLNRLRRDNARRMARAARMRQNDDSSSDDDSSTAPVATPQESTAANSTTDEPAKASDEPTKASDDAKPAEGESKAAHTDKKPDAEGEKKDAVPKVEKLDPELVGMNVGLKHLYSGKEDKKGRFQWQTTIPEDVGKPAEDAETQKWALIVRHIKVYNDPSKVLAVHSIVVQSPLLKDLLKGVLKGYPGVTVGLQRLEFGSKFEPLIHRWPQLTAAIEELKKKVKAREAEKGETNADGKIDKEEEATQVKHEEVDKDGKPVESQVSPDHTKSETKPEEKKAEEKGPDEKEDEEAKETSTSASAKETKPDPDQQDITKLRHAELLYDLLVSEFQTLIDSSQDMKAKGVMTYEYLWTLFQPGSFIFSKVEGQERIFRLRSGRYGQDRDGNPVYWLIMMYVDYDGVRFGYQKLNVSIRAFSGTKAISTLASYPLEFHQHKDDLKTRLLARGTKLESLAGTHYRSYDGMGWREGNWGQKEKYSVKGRIIVDTYGWNRFDPNASVYVNPLTKDALDIGADQRSGSGDDDDDFGDFDNDMEDGMPIDGHFADEDEGEDRAPLDEDQKLICTHLVRGYALKEKLWLNMYVNSVSEIAFNTRAFDSLVLPESQKELILGFTSSQQSFRNQFDDVIEGKGRGIILLLSGPPGVGKTLTAESVAEEMRVPLFVMSAGDVGLDSRHIETRLLDVFEMVTRWNAILLLDEADVFLEERSLHEIERNKLVSIFLRVLEYYEGIMFLTTNRVQTFDAAFQSRIHISLDYPELSIESRKQVWKNFLKQHDVVQKMSREKGPAKGIASSIKNTPTKADKKDSEKDVDSSTTTDGTTDPTSPTNKPAESQAEPVTDKPDDASPEKLEADKNHHLATQLHCITDRDINELCRMHMNGRQIKNVLKTAQLLASRRKEGLSKKHIQTVLDVTQHLHNSNRENERTRSSIFS
ncbi:Mitochondrial inner membrane i-AAA protease supercomplex subunit YME1 [Elsinoe australis]|uniref:Mitochondrial inner membrane i-AAA protease supercomplex subunit YME1 n=1 Tax=Elsinoe australis TaxID=40998 RepID=A0A2P8AIW1_9PEZI|nr:Mitochondrial inner membrane i-AAA protease supercomplex subunit YME1 [Elsinoe australis]